MSALPADAGGSIDVACPAEVPAMDLRGRMSWSHPEATGDGMTSTEQEGRDGDDEPVEPGERPTLTTDDEAQTDDPVVDPGNS